jgi:flagellar biosynthesis protein FliR
MQFTFLPQVTIVAFLVFARVGTLVMLMPSFGERTIPVRVRLGIALMLTLIFYPLVRKHIPDPEQLRGLFLFQLLFTELGAGLILGLTARLLGTVLNTAGNLIGQYLGLSFAMMVDPTQGGQGAVLSSFLSLLGIVLVFTSDLHHLVIIAIHDSYQHFKPGSLPDLGDAAAMIMRMMSHTFAIAMQISAPFLVVGLILNVGLGLVSKMMPQMQVFFVAMPLAIGLGFALLAVILTAMMTLYLNDFSATLGQFLHQKSTFGGGI